LGKRERGRKRVIWLYIGGTGREGGRGGERERETARERWR
jgi:hypothetical protein